MRGSGEACRRQGIAFLPMVVESFGGWHEVAEREVRKLGAALACHTDQEESEAIAHLWGRLVVLVQRGNAAILGNRVPSLPDSLIDSNLKKFWYIPNMPYLFVSSSFDGFYYLSNIHKFPRKASIKVLKSDEYPPFTPRQSRKYLI